MSVERIVYGSQARKRMKRRNLSHGEVKRVLNDPDITHPSEDGENRMVARGQADDGRRMGVVYTEDHDYDADVFVVTVIDFDTED
jgi:uncharacterized DUF497 family protein